MKTVNDGLRKSSKASAPASSLHDVSFPLEGGGVWGRVRQYAPHHDPCGPGQLEHLESVAPSDEGEGESGNDPADRSKHADQRELLARVGHMVERQRVGQSQRRKVAERVPQKDHVDDRGRRRGCGVHQGRRQEHEAAAQHMQGAEHPLGGEEAVGDHSHEERGDDAGKRPDRVRPAEVAAGEADLDEVQGRPDVPGAPDEELQKHHCAEARRGTGKHRPIVRDVH